MFSHAMSGACDLARMGAFQDAVPALLGLCRRWEGQEDGGLPGTGCAPSGKRVSTFFVHGPFGRRPAGANTGCLAPILAPFPVAVRPGHAVSGADESAPPRHGRGYHGAHPRGPVGNELHVVRRGGLAAGQ